MSPALRPVDRIGPDAFAGIADRPLAVSGLTVAYHHKPVLWNVDYVAPPSGLIAIVGPNGAGKSTFIRSVLGLVPRLAGDIRVYGKSVDRQRRLIGYVPQRSSVDWDFPLPRSTW